MNATKPVQAIGYARISSRSQEGNLSIPAQKSILAEFCKQRGMELTDVRNEIESGKRSSNRPVLQACLAEARATGKTVVISRLDRLSRQPSFLHSLKESNVSFLCCDCPEMSPLLLAVLSSIAAQEVATLSTRIKSSLLIKREECAKAGTVFYEAQAKQCGRIQALGVAKAKQNAANRILARRKAILGIFHGTGEGKYLTTANVLNELSVPSITGAGKWYPASVKRIVEFREG